MQRFLTRGGGLAGAAASSDLWWGDRVPVPAATSAHPAAGGGLGAADPAQLNHILTEQEGPAGAGEHGGPPSSAPAGEERDELPVAR